MAFLGGTKPNRKYLKHIITIRIMVHNGSFVTYVLKLMAHMMENIIERTCISAAILNTHNAP